MLRPLHAWVLWLCLAAWFAAGVGGLTTPAERLTYAETRALARLAVDLTPDRKLLDENGSDRLLLRERPGAAFAALPFYALGRAIGRAFPNDDPADPFGMTARVTQLAAAFAAATALTLIALCAAGLGVSPAAATIAVAALAFGSPLAAYGSRLAPPIFGLLAVALAVYPLLRLRDDDERLHLRLMLGAGLGLMFLLDDAMLLLLAAMLLWTASRARQVAGRPSWAIAFLPPLLAGALLFFAVNAVAWGGPFAAPDGLSLGAHFRREYFLHNATENFIFGRLGPGLGFWWFHQGAMSERLALVSEAPAALRSQVFLGLFAWAPLLALGWLGAFAMRRDEDARLPLRLLGLFFWLASGMHAVAAHFVDPVQYDAAALLPFCFPLCLGLGHFVEYHLVGMPGLIWKNLLRLVFLGALAISLANGWLAIADAHDRAVQPAPAANRPAALPPATAAVRTAAPRPEAIRYPLPASNGDAFFLNFDRLFDRLRRNPFGLFAAARPGLDRYFLFFAPLLWAIALLPALAARLARRVAHFQPRNEVEGVRTVKEHAPADDESAEPPISQKPPEDEAKE